MSAFAFRSSAVLVLALALAAPAHGAVNVLDNGTIRVEVDLDAGGRISSVSPSRGARIENLVQDSEQAYSFGGNQAEARVVESSNDGHTLHVRSFSDDCLCAYDTWVKLDGRAALVRQRVTTMRSTSGVAFGSQEVPPLYSGVSNTRVVTYEGGSPYTRGALHDVTALANYPLFQFKHYDANASEHWIALVGSDGRGVGLVEPDVSRFVAISQPYEAYVAGVRLEDLDPFGTYEYAYALVVGSLAQIRAYAYAHRPDERPNYLFAADRQHFTLTNATDFGAPIRGALRVRVDQNDPYLVGPDARWRAGAVPRLYIRGAWHTNESHADLFWSHPGGAFDEQQKRSFSVVPGGGFFTYRLDLFRSPAYRGAIGGIRLDPVPGSEPDGSVDITCISYRPCPIDRAAERRLLAEPRVPYVDTFDRLDSTFWSVSGNSTGAVAAVGDGRLRVSVAHDAKPLLGQNYVAAGLYSRCAVDGDFTAQVDYELLDWPGGNDVQVSFRAGDEMLYRSNAFGEQASAFFPPVAANAPDDRSRGTLRFERVGGTVYGMFADDSGRWHTLAAAQVSGPVHLALSAIAKTPGADVVVAFDNVRITRGQLTCG